LKFSPADGYASAGENKLFRPERILHQVWIFIDFSLGNGEPIVFLRKYPPLVYRTLEEGQRIILIVVFLRAGKVHSVEVPVQRLLANFPPADIPVTDTFIVQFHAALPPNCLPHRILRGRYRQRVLSLTILRYAGALP